MITLHKPSHIELKEFIWDHRETPFNYKHVGGTRSHVVPRGFLAGKNRVKLGHGRMVYLNAKRAHADWKMFPAEFVDLIWPHTVQEGRVVATLFYAMGVWTLNPCRVIYTFDGSDPTNDQIERCGFAYGTIGPHLAAGEERFTIEYDHTDESVWYEVYSFSRANRWLSKLTYPYMKWVQKRFRHLSAQAMQNAVASMNTTEPTVKTHSHSVA